MFFSGRDPMFGDSPKMNESSIDLEFARCQTEDLVGAENPDLEGLDLEHEDLSLTRGFESLKLHETRDRPAPHAGARASHDAMQEAIAAAGAGGGTERRGSVPRPPDQAVAIRDGAADSPGSGSIRSPNQGGFSREESPLDAAYFAQGTPLSSFPSMERSRSAPSCGSGRAHHVGGTLTARLPAVESTDGDLTRTSTESLRTADMVLQAFDEQDSGVSDVPPNGATERRLSATPADAGDGHPAVALQGTPTARRASRGGSDGASRGHSAAKITPPSRRSNGSRHHVSAAHLGLGPFELETLRAKNETLESELSLLKRLADTKSEESARLQQKLAEREHEVRLLARRLEEERAERARPTPAYAAEGGETGPLQLRIVELEAQRDEHRRTLEEQRQVQQTVEEAASGLREMLRDANEARQQMAAELEALRWRTEALERDEHAWRAKAERLEELEGRHLETLQELEEAQKQLHGARTSIVHMTNKLCEAQEESKKWSVLSGEQQKDVQSLTWRLQLSHPPGGHSSADHAIGPDDGAASALMEDLNTRVDALLWERRTLRDFVHALQAEAHPRSAALVAATEDVSVRRERQRALEASASAKLEALTQLAEKRAGRDAGDSVATDLSSDASFSAPSLSEHSSDLESSLQHALATTNELLRAQHDISFRLAGGKAEVAPCHQTCREIGELIVVQDRAIRAIQENLVSGGAGGGGGGGSGLDGHGGPGMAARRIEPLHSTPGSERAHSPTPRRAADLERQLKAAEAQHTSVRDELARERRWVRPIASRIIGLAAEQIDLHDERTAKTIERALDEREMELRRLSMRADETDRWQRAAAELRFQKRVVLQVTCERGAPPPGVLVGSGRVEAPAGRLRALCMAVLAAVRLSRTSGRSMPVAESDRFLSFDVPPPVWRQHTGGGSAERARLVGALEQRDQWIAEVSAKLGAVAGDEPGPRVVLDRFFAEWRRTDDRVGREMGDAMDRVDILLDKWRLANEAADKAHARARAERKARRSAEAKASTYAERAESRAVQVRRLREDSRRRDESVRQLLDQLRSHFNLDHDAASDAGKENPAPPPGRRGTAAGAEKAVGAPDNGLLHDLQSRQRRANRLLETLARSAKHDLDAARAHSSAEARALAHQIESYLTGLESAARKLDAPGGPLKRAPHAPLTPITNTARFS